MSSKSRAIRATRAPSSRAAWFAGNSTGRNPLTGARTRLRRGDPGEGCKPRPPHPLPGRSGRWTRPLPALRKVTSVTRVEEVTGMELRYFDGHGWSNEWSSLARKSLPVAVEATLHVRLSDERSPTPDDVAANRRIANKGATSDRNATDRATANKFVANRDAANRSTANVAGQGNRAAMTAADRTYRLLVYLPTTALAHSIERNRPGPKPIVVQRRADQPTFAPPAEPRRGVRDLRRPVDEERR